ncbi:MAG: adenine deaminase [Anaerolineaceae bacterium]|nr:adenine deaminase [Anaerolineae bacterium]MCB9457184.1 adenine deaminase [Anaerolineaceae bacterium]
MTLVDRLVVARGEQPATLALRNARLVNVWTGEIYPTDILIQGSHIAAIGAGYNAHQEIDLGGRYVCPGFIDAHVHIESSLCTPPEFSRAVLTHGVTTVITDPHEIANVLGLEGIRFMLERAKNGPMSMYVMASSCVPATHMETSGARLEAEDLAQLVNHNWVLGLAEVMNYPGVVYGDEGMLDKIALFGKMVLDGHCPALTGKELNAYVSTGIGSEHECTTVEEALEKLRLGLTVFIREGTTTRNLRPLLPLVTPENHTRLCFCTDDRVPASLIDDGSIDYMVRTAIAEGIDPVMAIRMGTLNTAQYFGLHEHGVIAPGKRADIVVFSDMLNLRPEMVFRGGKLVAENGKMLTEKTPLRPIDLRSSMNVRLDSLDFAIPAQTSRIRVIGAVGDQVVTGHVVEDARIVDGLAVSDPERDILKMAVVERHRATGGIGKGFIKGFGLKRGAIAGTVAHDHHNLVVIGVDDASMRRAVQAVVDIRGGLVAVDGDQVLGELSLPVAGLMSERPLDDVRHDYDALTRQAQALGSTMHDPFMAMSFMALEVIPKLKLTDLGLVDVEQFKMVELFV